MKKILTVSAFLAFICAIIFAAIYDLKISETIANENLLWARILEVVGEPPALIFTSFNLSLVLAYQIKLGTKNRMAYIILSAVGFVISTGYPIYSTYNYKTPMPIFIAVSAVIIALSIGFIIINLRSNEEYLKKYIKTACVCIGIAITALVVLVFVKALWGRVRYRQLDEALKQGMGYTAWYVPQFFSGYRSFPSGHTGNATVIFSLVLYFPKQRKWLCPILVIWICTLAVSRVFVGAHYLSDVLFGGALTSLIIYIWCKTTGAWRFLANE